MAAEQPDTVIWARSQGRLRQSLRAALGLCFATLASVALAWRTFGRDELPLDARSALLFCLTPLLVLGVSGALYRAAVQQRRWPLLTLGTLLGGLVGLVGLGLLLLALSLGTIALVMIATTTARTTATTVLLAALLASAGGFAIAFVAQLAGAIVLVDERPAVSVAFPPDATTGQP